MIFKFLFLFSNFFTLIDINYSMRILNSQILRLVLKKYYKLLKRNKSSYFILLLFFDNCKYFFGN